MPHAYVSVTTLKGTGALNVDGTAYDIRLRQLLESISYQIDRYCNRTFQSFQATNKYGGDGSTLLLINDLVSIGTLQEDDNNDGTFDTGWATTDYILEPSNALPTKEYGRPYTAIRVNPKSTGTQDEFLAGPERYQIPGTWGYSQYLTTAAPSLSGSLGSTATAILVSTVGIEAGNMILVDSEIMYVQSTATTTLTVVRPEKGSTAGTHASGTVIQLYNYPGPVTEAAFIMAARLWQRRNSGFATQVGIPETGLIQTWRGAFDPDVRDLLFPYRRLH